MTEQSNSASATMLYGSETEKAINNFQISELKMPRAFLQALGHLKCACADANIELKQLDNEIGEAIKSAAIEIAKGEHDKQFPVDVFQTGSGTSTNMNANEVIANLASKRVAKKVHPNDHVNRGQSSNDVISSAIHICAAVEVNNRLLPAIKHLACKIDEKASQNRNVVKTGRTHLMDALPMTVAQELSAWSGQLHNTRLHLESCLEQLYKLSIGGTAIGTGLNCHPNFSATVTKMLSERINLPFQPGDNKFTLISSQDAAVALSGALKVTAVAITKIANDLRWLNSGPISGLSEISLPALQAGSSIMPGKVNPVIPESNLMACAQVIGNDLAITIAAQSGNFQLNTGLPLIAYNLLQSIKIMSNSCLNLADKAIAGMHINQVYLQQRIWRNPILVTALTDRLGYDKCAEIVEKATSEDRSILDIAEEVSGIPREELETILKPLNLANAELREPES